MADTRKSTHTRATTEDVLEQLERFKDTIDRWRVQYSTEQKRHSYTLYGNGEPGMDERIRNIEKNLQLILKLMWIILSGVVTYVIIYAGDILLR